MHICKAVQWHESACADAAPYTRRSKEEYPLATYRGEAANRMWIGQTDWAEGASEAER